MKTLYCILFIVGAFYSCSPKVLQSPDVPFQPLMYEAVIKAPGLSDKEIIKRVSRVIVKSFNDYQSVFQYQDSSFLAINGGTETSILYTDDIVRSKFHEYQFVAQSKPGKCRVTFSRFKYQDPALNLRTKISTPTREVAVKKIMVNRNITETVRKIELQAVEIEYGQLNRFAKEIIDEIELDLNDPTYDTW